MPNHHMNTHYNITQNMSEKLKRLSFLFLT